LSAIAVPESFENALKSFGADLIHCYRFADHHRYSQQEIINIINHSNDLGADAIITTEKDAVRFPFIDRRDISVFYMRVEIEMITGEEEFISWIDRICFKSSRITN
jgi:tetraacyldisaccharide 4'-kinase